MPVLQSVLKNYSPIVDPEIVMSFLQLWKNDFVCCAAL